MVYFNDLGGDKGDDWPEAAVRYGSGNLPVGYLIMVGSVQRNAPSTANSDFAIVRVMINNKVFDNGFD